MFHAHFNEEEQRWSVFRGDDFLFYLDGLFFSEVNHLVRVLNSSNP